MLTARSGGAGARLPGLIAAGDAKVPQLVPFYRAAGQFSRRVRRRRRQEGSGRARNRVKALLNWFSQGQYWGRCKVRRRALRVSRPAKAKKRRLRVLVVITVSPKLKPRWNLHLWNSENT